MTEKLGNCTDSKCGFCSMCLHNKDKQPISCSMKSKWNYNLEEAPHLVVILLTVYYRDNKTSPPEGELAILGHTDYDKDGNRIFVGISEDIESEDVVGWFDIQSLY